MKFHPDTLICLDIHVISIYDWMIKYALAYGMEMH